MMGLFGMFSRKKEDAKHGMQQRDVLDQSSCAGKSSDELARLSSKEMKDLDARRKEEAKREHERKKEEQKTQRQIIELRKAVSRFHRLKMENGSVISKYIYLRKRGKNFSPKGLAQKYNRMYNLVFEKMYDREGHVIGVHDPHYHMILTKLRHPYNEILEFLRELRSKSIDDIDKTITEHHVRKIHEAEHAVQEGVMIILRNQHASNASAQNNHQL